MNCDKDDMIEEFEEKPAHPKSNLASMGIYIFNYKTLRKYLLQDDKNPDSSHDFGKDIIPAYLNDHRRLAAYRFKGYWKDVGTVDSLWESNMDLLESNNQLDLGDQGWKIYTENINSLPTYIGDEAKINNAYITQGSIVLGEVKNSVIGTGAEIGKGAKVVDSVIQPGATGAVLGSSKSEHIDLVAKKYAE